MVQEIWRISLKKTRQQEAQEEIDKRIKLLLEYEKRWENIYEIMKDVSKFSPDEINMICWAMYSYNLSQENVWEEEEKLERQKNYDVKKKVML